MYKYNPFTRAFDIVTDISAKADLVNGKVHVEQLPSYVDDVIEVANFAALPLTGEQGKIYVTLDDNKNYRWSGSAYILLNPVDLSNYYNKNEVYNSLALTQLNSLPVLLSTNTVVNTTVYPRNTTFVCSGAITVEINPALSVNGTEYTFINGDDSVITLNPTAAKVIGFYTSNYTLTNKGQSVTLVKRSDTFWDIKNEFTDANKKIAVQASFQSQSGINPSQNTTLKINTGSYVNDTGIFSNTSKSNACISYNPGSGIYAVNKTGWYELSGNISVSCYFGSSASAGGNFQLVLSISNNTGGSASATIGTMGCYANSSESSPNTKVCSFSQKVYLIKNSTFYINYITGSACYGTTTASTSTMSIEYLGN